MIYGISADDYGIWGELNENVNKQPTIYTQLRMPFIDKVSVISTRIFAYTKDKPLQFPAYPLFCLF